MQCSLIILACFSLSLLNEAASSRIFQRGRLRGGLLGEPNVSYSGTLPPDEWFIQQLDHFDPTNRRTWKQRYFTNASFHQPGGPVFLMIGGEGKASPLWMVTGQWITYAKQYNALCFQLEHRYYGKSHPTQDLSVKNLVFLSSEQALADIAYFIEGMNKKHNLTLGTKWVVFGGSYPGSLAAWARAKYPHLVHAAVSASGPLLAKSDFGEYYRVVSDALATSSADCVSAVERATAQISIMLQHMVGQQTLKKMFRLCDPINPKIKNDLSNLFESLASNFAGVVQYNKDNRQFEGAKATNITIDVVCNIMVNDSIGQPVSRYAAVNSLLLDAYGQECLDYKYSKMIEEMKAIAWDNETAEGGRQWTYQTCTEFGFYQTSSKEPKLFGDNFPVDFFIQQCSDIFGPKYNSDFLKAVTYRTNTLYGAFALQATRVVYVHGSIDPWHALGITHTLLSDSPAIFIQGTAHCANMYPSAPNDPPQLVAARKKVGNLIGKWLLH
ncbi:putative serine protease K12H4.7 [Schistocerca nitens]|uniref:putative serine protease K12H4.7 n=1 Tax=Schistocerca nitens TaxID=7011 RepID=UPI0021172F8B|nr:putative serine protease K12H4.7 [Schistocerca nitens]XP_049810860.1 putative serine protease K12H4.7 [Schistocerca nitens]